MSEKKSGALCKQRDVNNELTVTLLQSKESLFVFILSSTFVG